MARHNMYFWTDYPLLNGHMSSSYNELYEVYLVSYDGDKYATVIYKGGIYKFKTGYLYSKKRNYSWHRRICKRLVNALKRVENKEPPFEYAK